ncbi:MAG TPA: carbonic anhydrase [Hyphomonas sp.]|nr:carbonic anhydrase [Hyphomonas sp.]HRI99794.1 carbonic anhydrase [Hyphomonas sp.]
MTRTLLENNLNWASARVRADPGFFRRLSAQQAPEYLWIGCSDSRVPANEIVGLDPGELFVHRNIANLAPPRDLNFLSVLQFSIEVLKVRHIIVCGHYGCGGVRAALDSERRGLIDHWLQPVSDLAHKHENHLKDIADFDTRVNVACEHNVRAQVEYLGRNPFVTDAWRRGQKIEVHGWIYSIRDGLLRDLDLTVERPRDVDELSSRAWFPDG